MNKIFINNRIVIFLTLLFTSFVQGQNQADFCETFTNNVRVGNINFKKSYVKNKNNCFIQVMYISELALDSRTNYQTMSKESKSQGYIETLTKMTLKSYNTNGISDVLIKNNFSEFRMILIYNDNSQIKSNKYNIISGEKIVELSSKSFSNKKNTINEKPTNQLSLDKIYKDINETYIKIDNHSNSIKLKSIFKKWEITMINDSIFDYVSETDCLNSSRMSELYEKGKYPMISESQLVVNLDYNNDDINDFIISYGVNNCVGGIGRGSYSDDFIFIKGKKNGQLEIDRNYTNYFKRKMIYLYREKFNVKSPINKNGFIHIPNISFYNFQNGTISGEMFLELNNYYPPKGKFSYSFIEDDFKLFDSYENLEIK